MTLKTFEENTQMPANKFRFISPGIQFREIDESTIQETQGPIGPVIIGRSQKGPGLVPTRVEDYDEFVRLFGEPQPGTVSGDIWRNGGEGLAPTYGAYAAQAYLENSNGLTFVRLLGRENKYSTTAGKAGWSVGSGFTGNAGAKGGAYGLFLVESGSTNGSQQGTSVNTTGTLAAVWYMQDVTAAAWLRLSGAHGGTNLSPTGANATTLLNEEDSTYTIEYVEAGVVQRKYNFDFDEDSGNFARKVFNTNPTKLNSTYYENSENFFLGETFERNVAEKGLSAPSSKHTVWGVMLGLQNSSNKYNNNKSSAGPASTNWIVCQDQGASGSFEPSKLTKLFRFKSRELGDHAQRNIKISFDDIRYSPDPDYKYGSFTVLVRDIRDSDNFPNVLESFTNCNLDPESTNYVANRIGNAFSRWDDDDKRYRYYGEYPNRSQYITIEMAEDVALGAVAPELLPFGYFGPLRPVSFGVASGSISPLKPWIGMSVGNSDNANTSAMVSNALPDTYGGINFVSGGHAFVGAFDFPRSYVRPNSTIGNLSSRNDCFWGLDTSRSGSSIRYSEAVVDTLRGLPDNYRLGEDGPTLSPSSDVSDYQYIFTLDDVSLYSSTDHTIGSTSSVDAFYLSGSRKVGYSVSSTGSNTYKNTLDDGYNKFTVPMFGGFNGLDITEVEPFNNNSIGSNAQDSYEYNSIMNAIDSVADPESVDMNILSVPGVTTTGLTDRVLDVTRERGDSLGVIDIVGGFKPKADRAAATTKDYDASARGSVDTTVSNMKTRQINNSYGAAYYPYIKIRDSKSGRAFFAPPSIAAIGTYSFSQTLSDVWFAPAGFVRGGLSDGAAGIPVVGVSERLSAKERDKLYEVNINPIASFPSEGIVVFGQKTLQATPSALDRVNVRRLLIYLKKGISLISSTILFDPNMAVTWDRFKSAVDPFLGNVKSRLGLMDYKIVLDETTTTPDLIDRNIMYAKIFIKPARAIEYIAIDFVVTNSGASFAD